MRNIITDVEKSKVLSLIKAAKKTSPISSNSFGMSDSRARKIVHLLREEGEPICTVNGSGYYFAQTSEDIEETTDYLRGLQRGLEKTLEKFDRLFVEYKIQEFKKEA